MGASRDFNVQPEAVIMKKKKSQKNKSTKYEPIKLPTGGPVAIDTLSAGISEVSDGEMLSIEPRFLNMVTVLEGEPPILVDAGKSRKKPNNCCDGVPIKPQCLIVSETLDANFRNLAVKIRGTHVCGIKSIAAFIALVTHQALPQQPGQPLVILRKLKILRVGGEMVAAAKTYSCPSNTKSRTFTATFPTAGFIGKPYCVRIAVKSCCNVADIHSMDQPCLGDSGDRLII